jgi:hypothetical protein
MQEIRLLVPWLMQEVRLLVPWLMQEIRLLVRSEPHWSLPADAPRRHISCISHKRARESPHAAWPGRVDL